MQRTIFKHQVVQSETGVSSPCGTLRWAPHGEKCLDVKDGATANGNVIQTWNCAAGNRNQLFVLPAGTGPIRWASRPDLCLDVQGGGTHNGNGIQLWTCYDGSPNQQFIVPDGGAGPVRWASQLKKCIDVAGGNTANGARIFLWDCADGNQNQQFSRSDVQPCPGSPGAAPAPAPPSVPPSPPVPVPPSEDGGPIAWPTTGRTAGSGWCQGDMPAAAWTLMRSCGSTFDVKVLSYNLFWWNLFGQRKGNGGSAGRLIADAGRQQPFDVMGFQECDSIARILGDAGLASTYGAVDGGKAIAIAYRMDTWSPIESGRDDVAEDARVKGQYFGRRSVAWVRLRHKATGKALFFMNHHGPLPVNSGGACGGDAVAYNMLRVVATHGRMGDAIVIVGDFNAGPNSATLRTLGNRIHHVYRGPSFGGVDNIFSSCGGSSVLSTQDLGSGGSDHNAISAVIRF